MKCLLHLILLVVLLGQSVFADERILSFNSDIRIKPDGSMHVKETITVRAEGRDIKRGIYRDFPTTYRDRLGNRYRVGFEVVSVTRDGNRENFHTKPRSNGIRIYFGQKNRLLKPGEYRYELVYNTNRQLGFFEEHDELYWNVTGNGWKFPIDSASAVVHLPGTVSYEQITAEAYTGRTGSREQRFSVSRVEADSVRVDATRPLDSYEGLTIVVGWPKGIIIEPTASERFMHVLKDNRHLIIAGAGLIILLIYYLVIWLKVGRDPEAGVVVARYKPPEGYSPASLRYIEKMGYDDTCFAAAIINLAVKGYLTITEEDDEYTLNKTGDTVDMAAGERALVKKLFGSGNSITLKQSRHKKIRGAIDAHKASLELNYEKEYFVTNSNFFIAGIALTIILLISIFMAQTQASDIGGSIFMIFWLSIWCTGVTFLIANAYKAWRNVHSIGTFIAALYGTAFAIPFVGGAAMGFSMLAETSSWSVVSFLLVAVGINWLFYELLKSPTHAGRKLLDHVEGFRRYVDIAERHELEYKHPKGRCPELFEMYLPFALAMGIEQQWGEQFADVLSQAQATGSAYQPVWYHGTHWNSGDIGSFSSSLGSSFTSAISSSSTAPGSSSGGGGGGFSGGGGGGGGGGGW